MPELATSSDGGRRPSVVRQLLVSFTATAVFRIVRHPGNLGMIIGTLGFPLLFQSTWSFVPAGLSVINLLVRTHLEDREQTRFRLLPGLW